MLGLLLVLWSLGLQQIFQPYSSETVNALDRSGLLVIAMTFFLGLLIDGPSRISNQCPSAYTEDSLSCKSLNTTASAKTEVCYSAGKACVEMTEVGLQWGNSVGIMNLLLSITICVINVAWMVIFAIIFIRIKFGKKVCGMFNKCSHALSVADHEDESGIMKIMRESESLGRPAPKVWMQVVDSKSGEHYLVAADTGEIRQLDQDKNTRKQQNITKEGVTVGTPVDSFSSSFSSSSKNRNKSIRRLASDQRLASLLQVDGDSSSDSSYYSDESEDEFEMMLERGETPASFELVWDQAGGTEVSSKKRARKKMPRRAANFLRQATRDATRDATREVEMLSNPMHKIKNWDKNSNANDIPAVAVREAEKKEHALKPEADEMLSSSEADSSASENDVQF